MSEFKSETPPSGFKPLSPFQRAAQVWDDRIGTATAQAANWRLVSLISLSITALSLTGNLWQSGQVRAVPYIVQINEKGEALKVEPLQQIYEPNDRQMIFFLADWISNIRSRSIDEVQVQQNWVRAFDYLDGEALGYMTRLAQQNPPTEKVGLEAVTVNIVKASKLTNRTYQIAFVQEHYIQGAFDHKEDWTATFTVDVRPSSSPDQIIKNPLGIYIVGIDINKDFGQ
ncbi:MAG: conjugal transfer protein TrbF [Rhodobiaceae bacterium]|nr:conjugal transfer protein TrbF [Rhodobiaceae bacterium]